MHVWEYVNKQKVSGNEYRTNRKKEKRWKKRLFICTFVLFLFLPLLFRFFLTRSRVEQSSLPSVAIIWYAERCAMCLYADDKTQSVNKKKSYFEWKKNENKNWRNGKEEEGIVHLCGVQSKGKQRWNELFSEYCYCINNRVMKCFHYREIRSRSYQVENIGNGDAKSILIKLFDFRYFSIKQTHNLYKSSSLHRIWVKASIKLRTLSSKKLCFSFCCSNTCESRIRDFITVAVLFYFQFFFVSIYVREIEWKRHW